MNTGIYRILNTVNGHCYIGSAVDLGKRRRDHKHYLRNGTHFNAHLQSAWKKYGGEAFTFSTLLVCERRHLLLFEQRCIDVLKPKYNINLTAGSRLGMKHTAETRAKLSAAFRGRRYPPEVRARMNQGHRGKIVSTETRAKMRASARARGQSHALADYWAINGRRISHGGITRSLTEWARTTGIKVPTLCQRLKTGWSVDQALTVPTLVDPLERSRFVRR